MGAVAKHSTVSGVRNSLTKKTLLYLRNTVAMRYYCLGVSLLSCDYLVSQARPNQPHAAWNTFSIIHGLAGWVWNSRLV